MTVTVAKATLIENIYKNFYDLITAITGYSTLVFPTFPDTAMDATADYPVVIIDSPNIKWDAFTFGKSLMEGNIDVTVYTTTAKDADERASDIADKIETSKGTLAGVKLRQVSLESTTSDMIPHGKIKVFVKTLTFKFKFYFAKTDAY